MAEARQRNIIRSSWHITKRSGTLVGVPDLFVTFFFNQTGRTPIPKGTAQQVLNPHRNMQIHTEFA
jgi:hypothetical protein